MGTTRSLCELCHFKISHNNNSRKNFAEKNRAFIKLGLVHLVSVQCGLVKMALPHQSDIPSNIPWVNKETRHIQEVQSAQWNDNQITELAQSLYSRHQCNVQRSTPTESQSGNLHKIDFSVCPLRAPARAIRFPQPPIHRRFSAFLSYRTRDLAGGYRFKGTISRLLPF